MEALSFVFSCVIYIYIFHMTVLIIIICDHNIVINLNEQLIRFDKQHL